MTLSIMGVHGVGNYDPRSTAADRDAAWTQALAKGFSSRNLPEFKLVVAYYADVLHLGTTQGHRPVDSFSPSEQDDVWAWLVASGLPGDLVAQGGLTKPIRQGLEWFARNFGLDRGAVDWFVGRFFPELGTYLGPDHPDRRSRARTIVGQTIDQHRPRVILAHSLGSVVTYEALWERPDRQVDLLVTMGSPLAMPNVVYERLMQPPGGVPPQRPPGVRRWVNVADSGDVISVVRPMSNYFDGVEVPPDLRIHGIDFHLAKHYLATPQVADLVSSVMTRPAG